jgi:arsenite/tail-anchored protein-transporting ATPase
VPTLLFTGPGGVGTTTLAAAAAVRAAQGGRRTVLLSAQRPPVPGLAEVTGLEVVGLSGGEALERFWDGHADALRAALPQLSLPPASSVVPLPGAGGVAVLAALARAEADVLVVDAGPLTAATELLALPDTLRFWFDQLLPPRLRALGAVRSAAVASGAIRRGPVDAALAALSALEQLLGRVRLGDPAGTAVVVVAPPRADAVAAVRATATALALHGQRVARVLVRGLPADALAGEWWAARRAEQQAAADDLAEVAPVTDVSLTAAPPGDVAVLAGLPVGDLPEPAPAGAAPRPERVDGGWQLTLPLPFAERADLSLTRFADDLVVTAAGTRRSVRLDALLRRCRVTGGRLADPGTAAARLEVSFVPDPQLWPADLLAAEGKAS